MTRIHKELVYDKKSIESFEEEAKCLIKALVILENNYNDHGDTSTNGIGDHCTTIVYIIKEIEYYRKQLTKDALQAIDDHLLNIKEMIADNLYCTEWPQEVNK